MEQLKAILVFSNMVISLAYTIAVVLAIILVKLGIGNIKFEKNLSLTSVLVLILWLSGICFWLEYFNII